MPGRAFTVDFGDSAFPLLPTKAHTKLKTNLTDKVKALYKLVGSPTSAPDKHEHGDIELVVYEPRGAVTHEQIRKALGATLKRSSENSRFSNYAVRISRDGKYVQVNIEVCENEAEWECVIFFHSYGDMGMILNLLARAHGLSLGPKGLKIHSSQSDKTHPPSFHLSLSFPDILRFMGLSMDNWEHGFKDTNEVFTWVQTSRFFVPRVVLETAKDVKIRNVQKRLAYQAFLAYSNTLASSGVVASKPTPEPAVVVQEALVFFEKKSEYDAIVKANVTRIAFKTKFTGKHVMAWTGLYGYAVHDVMKGVRERLGEEGIVASEIEDIEKVTREVQQKLNLYPKRKD